MKKNYIIPFEKRFVSMGGYATTLMCVDNVGLIVTHRGIDPPEADEVRRNLIGTSDYHTVLIQAESLQQALQEFYNYPECKIGTKYRAWTIMDSNKRPVIEYAGCPFMFNRKSGDIECRRYDDMSEPEGQGYMICKLDGLDEPPSDCVIDHQMSGIEKNWRSEVSCVGGVWVKRFSKLVKPVDPLINGVLPIKIKTTK